MAHEISKTADGRDAFAAAEGVKVWHGLGQRLTPGATIEQWKKDAGMDYQIRRGEVFYQTDLGLLPGEKHTALYRGDTGALLSVMTQRYKEVQPSEILDFFRRYVEAGGWKLSTAGVLRGGRHYWAMAESGESYSFAGDRVFSKLFLGSSCDGTMATLAIPTSVSVVCANTLAMMLSDAEGAQSRSHRQLFLTINHRATFDADKVATDLGAIHGVFERFSRGAEKLAQVGIDAEERALFAQAVVRGGARVQGAALEQMQNGPGQEMESRRNGLTLWGAVSGVTSYFDHVAGREQERRFFEAQLGQGARSKVAAHRLAHHLAEFEPADRKAELLLACGKN